MKVNKTRTRKGVEVMGRVEMYRVLFKHNHGVEAVTVAAEPIDLGAIGYTVERYYQGEYPGLTIVDIKKGEGDRAPIYINK